MASIQKRNLSNGETRYLVRWRDPDGAERTRSCPTLSSARELRRATEESKALGRRWTPEAAVRIPLMSDLFEGWISELIRLNRAERTIRRAHDAAICFLSNFPDCADIRLMTRDEVAKFDLAERERGKSTNTRRATLWAIRGAWTWGQTLPAARGVLDGVSMPPPPMVLRRHVLAPSWEQMDAVCEATRVNAEEYPQREWLRRLAILLRGLGWRQTQIRLLDWRDIDLAKGEIRCIIGKSQQERRGRTQPLATWLADELQSWPRKEGLVIGSTKSSTQAPAIMRKMWAKTPTPTEIYHHRPDHAFRIGLISGLTAFRAPPDAIEYYVGHSLESTRAAYLDPSTIGLDEVAKLIPPIQWGRIQIPYSRSLRSERGREVVRGLRAC